MKQCLALLVTLAFAAVGCEGIDLPDFPDNPFNGNESVTSLTDPACLPSML